ncbi:MAG TPA: hypothetical protein VK705_01360 [Ferruginibacter sp.]|jgi:hypothetical protein|nr:hypothetical protein [Ferruginibacter sp.]
MEINNHDQLKAAISQLEREAILKKELLVDQFHTTYENLQPINIIKNQLSKIIGSSTVQNDAVGTAMGVGAGLLSKKVYERGSNNIFKQLLGTALEFGVAGIVANNSEKIKEVAANLLDKLFKPKEKPNSFD